MFYVLSGRGRASCGGKTYDVEKGDTLVLSPGTEHVVENTGPDRLYCLTVMVPNEGFAEMIRKMKSIDEGGSSLLDNSMILYTSYMADGGHGRDDYPALLAGRAQGTIKPGRHLAFRRQTPMSNLYVEMLDRIINQAMQDANQTFETIDGVAAAAGPGLIGGVIVGLTTAKAIALVSEKPLMAVNHLEAHALTARLTDNTPFPYCLFLASGGHTQIVAVRGVGDYVRIGTTRDDAIGEAFDKTAKLLGLGYPGGPQVEKEADRGVPGRFELPRPMHGRPEADFSLSGLKTALRLEAERIAPLSDADVSNTCVAV
jgi:hypothetical protein